MERAFQVIEATIAQVMADHRLPGLVLGVLVQGRSAVRAFGTANLETDLPVTPETLFQIGSISKVLTTTALMPQVARGRVELDRPVRAHLPSFRVADSGATERITLRHLLSHTGGFDGNIYVDVGPSDDALERDVALLAGTPQRAAPGELWHYANGGFSVAGHLLERIHDRVFEEAMRRALLDPLGMERTCFGADEAILHPVAAGHALVGDALTVTRPWAMPRQAGPAGGMVASAGDLLAFARHHLADDGPLRPMCERQVLADPRRCWGLGWWLREVDGVRIVGHNGLTWGFTAQLTLVPERDAAIVLLTNRDEAARALLDIEAALFRELLGLGWWEPAPIAPSPEALRPFAGSYADGETTFVAEVAGSRLRVERSDGDPFELVPLPVRGFRGEGPGFDGKYGDILPGPDGSPARLRFIGILADRQGSAES